MAEEALATAAEDSKRSVDTLRGFIEGYIRNMTSELGTCVVLTEYYSLTAQHHEAIQRRRRVVDADLRVLVARCVAEGTLAPCDPKLAVFFFMGAINNINRWFTEKGETDGATIATRFADHVINGLRGPR